mmetsp:Transcript_94132/g.176970  ORF Transcript_94132/g.176970 Transcript_94132/m.176970 type:complete len:561 (+) Transcript_94132:116-1798(+)
MDGGDCQLEPSSAQGSLQSSLEALRAHRRKIEEAAPSLDTEAARSNAVSEPSAKPDSWSKHQFAVHVIRCHVKQEVEAAIAAGTDRQKPAAPDESLPGAETSAERSDAEEVNSLVAACKEDDIPEDACDAAPDAALEPIADFADFLDPGQTPPLLGALMVRSLLLVGRKDEADTFFQAVFAISQKLQDMIVTREVPAWLLRGVRKQRLASITLRRLLATYETMECDEICDLVENIFLDELIDEEHCYKVIVQHALMRHLILWMRSGGASDGARTGALAFNSQASGADRLRQVGERLFTVAFVAHRGFLPSALNECPWDSGALDLQMLEHVSATEDALQLARRVLLRCLHREVSGSRARCALQTTSANPCSTTSGTAAARKDAQDAQAIAGLWPLGRWTVCQDVVLISEAFRFLCACWRAVVGLPGLGDISGSLSKDIIASGAEFEGIDGTVLVGTGSRRLAEELLFKMFADLEIWRLPHKDLLMPWLPGQILACHIAAQCQQLEDKQATLVEETRENLEEIATLNTTIAQLTARLEATDARSQQCMQKQADLNDHLRQLR